MKLISLISADIYRDGGSLEATWLTDEQKEWTLCLHVRSWQDPREVKTYHLYACKLNERAAHQRLEKHSAGYQPVMEAVEAWASSNTLTPEGLQIDRDSIFSLLHLMDELRAGHY